MIERNIYVYKKTNVPPVYVVYGSDSVSIKINLLDYDVPSGATATAYASLRRGSTVYTNSATISGNSITVSPAVGFFVPGENNLQIDVTYNGKKLVTFALDVNCEGQLSNNGSATAPSIRTVAQVDADLTTLSGTVSTKVAQEAGKGLSSNDYTDSAKAKVDAIPANPKYTDTVYDDTLIKQDIAALQSAIGSGLTTAQKNALDGLAKCLRDAGCTTEYTAFYNAFFGSSPSEITVVVSGSTMTISGFTATSVYQSGATLNIA